MTSSQRGGNIIPAVSRVLVERGKPLTPVSDPHAYAYYTERMGIDPSDKAVDERFQEQARIIGRSAERVVPSQNRQEHSTGLLSLLNESIALMPEEPGEPFGFDAPVREAGSVTLDFNSYHLHQNAATPTDNFSNLASWLAIGGTIFDNGRVVLDRFHAGERCYDANCDRDFSDSRQMKVLSQLGLRGLFNTHLTMQQGHVFSGTETNYVLSDDETARLGSYLQSYFSGNEDVS